MATSINIPQILAVAVVGFLAIRWWMSKPPTTASGVVDPVKIDQVSSMFPQLDRRSIAWDLQRNGGSVEATTERVLGGRGLETPPPSFQPQRQPQPAAELARPDLITRYGLQGKVMGKEEQQQAVSGWSSDKVVRAEGLKRRREEMILAARRKMMEKDDNEAAS
ncbi:hypothetical protein AC579_2175 [Pseudocercospora musae]|uniref:Coupling of ubiquitin conjugation to ER degradation protein 1 n=1 Tax=Pseudocercospora musae TaxID=113226 RepID=A0A139HYE5_9PEZI|nr:hypothetical protein AC579_2175 [Pseudocercospora musae]